MFTNIVDGGSNQYTFRAEEDKALEQFKKWAESQNSRIKPCPLCHSFIEKTEGCNVSVSGVAAAANFM